MATLSGSIVNDSAAIAISTVAPVDWAIASESSYGVFGGWIRKSDGGSLITLKTGANADHTTADEYDTRSVTWTGGAPTASGTSAVSAWASNGATLTFPADTNPRTIRIYWGTYYDGTAPKLQVSASLSDSSAAAWNPSLFTVTSGSDSMGYVEVTYAAASSGQTMTVTLGASGTDSASVTRIKAAGITQVYSPAPTLSLPGVQDIGQTTARLKVTITYP